MDKQNLIIFKFKILYEIIKEQEENLSFNIIEVNNEKALNEKLNTFQNNITITPKNIDVVVNQFILNQVPIKFSRLIEKLNIQFLKLQFNEKSELSIGKYKINLNSRELIAKDIF